ncbi:winged helix-turn-helix transcriptional regulator [Phaeobacter gallaeciensis]|uniref:Helix-turn-helix domain-containing protein n=2 Tax=Phaeobacter gallaeciensis TaxID=60890 RepID=A0ABD4XFD9_9RHOB|nr:helix-turn-helix domain-containing protein [Phaeobacter gallaeciensis]MDE4142126.1 helix-turn-helix domain-containing protein [Phaeobacter gallaeciensis]MDE4146560.1 helix-turn-helix domain-containing protein [Phaeobacter gallaeciensis]MDE4150633.1 helix-turn-helix domain-containing protein [Phaeobacter gallaeciensis]MDE4154812.1 helix-turn-helix domain-containing protein [Phaeobacter gallaeciensis]MDE4159298.1 helix-turn-helix domain-containing protein [Phaeobacter gallaeciensis]
MESSAPPRSRRGNLRSPQCPSRILLQHLTSRWGALVLLTLQDEKLRYGALRRAVGGISERMLSKTLNALEIDGLVHREVIEMMPPHVEYSLTPLGAEAVLRLRPLADWIEDNLPRVGAEWARRGVIGPDGSVKLPE